MNGIEARIQQLELLLSPQAIDPLNSIPLEQDCLIQDVLNRERTLMKLSAEHKEIGNFIQKCISFQG